jgi:hypothetical protein
MIIVIKELLSTQFPPLEVAVLASHLFRPPLLPPSLYYYLRTGNRHSSTVTT